MSHTAEILRLEAASKWVAGSPDGFETLIEALRAEGSSLAAEILRLAQGRRNTAQAAE